MAPTRKRTGLRFEEVAMDMTPMIDMVFLLLIFFMFTATFHDINIDKAVDLANAQAAKPDERPPGTLIINIHKDNEGIYLDGRRYTQDQLLGVLTALRQEDPNQEIVIRGDGRAFHRNLIHVMECCAKAGLLNVKVAVTKEKLKEVSS